MSDKKQTALQLAIVQLKKHKEILKTHFEEGKWNDDRCSEIDNSILILECKLDIEKTQIIEAYKIGFGDAQRPFIPTETYTTFEQYYNETYEH